ncbi:DoxX family membrane protein [Spirosoma sp. HMF4905]|uniref:DoxX family membrane protein n=1 Tax=Spirosoma arboris TaxID=2682092 RepID=A0A7K1SBW8_9BACT|nr:DoxX family protein [Spirosoma arboris]MVM31313.1 DoxX family membrane protein [Spirosoma arboris]
MNSALWFTQAFLAVAFMYSGWMKSTRSAHQLVAMGQTGVEHLSTPLIRFIGISELIGVVGLLVPWYTQLLPILTPIAALCLGLIMIPASVIHYRRDEKQNVLLNVILFLLCGFVVYGRWV